jgi:hypothetical protein
MFVIWKVSNASSWSSRLIVCGSFVAVVACGKKGPPLAPIVRIPAAVAMIQAQRVGSDAFVTLSIPNTNIDRSTPVDITRVEVYGYTGRRPPSPARFVEFADLVASIPVIPPPPADAPPGEAAPVDPSKGALPGTMVTVLDRLSGQNLVQGKVEEAPARGSRAPTPVATAALPEPDVLRRVYIAIAFSARGRPGPPSANAEFPLIEAPEPPTFVAAPYSETMVALQWNPSGGILGFLFNSALPPEDPPLNEFLEPIVQPPATPAAGPDVTVPSGPVKYNVYRELEPDPFAPPDPIGHLPWTEARPMPINTAPLDAMTFSDSVEFNRERCYIVRAIRGMPPNTVEGDASTPNCFIPVDVFPPVPPVRLVAVADEGGISLIWEPNAEPDVAGYLVLRGEPSDATLQPLTPTPVAEARFRDTHVSTGKKYVYAVVAVDSRLPFGNISAESNRVEETAR